VNVRVSVVMPSFNAEQTLREAVESVLAQTEPSFELLVVDDGSVDRTVEIASAFHDPRVRLIRHDHRGAAAARNLGIEAARAPLVSFVDSDDLLMPTYLEVMAATLDANPSAGFAHTDAYMLDVASGRIRRAVAMARDKPDPIPSDAVGLHIALLETNFIYNAVIVRKGVFELLGGFDESLKAGIDYEMWLRILANGIPAVQGQGILAVYRWGRSGSISASRERVLVNLAQLYETAAERHPGSPSTRAIARKRRAAVEAELAAVRGARTPRALAVRGRDKLVRLRGRRYPERLWYPRSAPPAELADAFPGLVTRAG
jgi:glycosyltransferase involved in cell wall biosynthesis